MAEGPCAEWIIHTHVSGHIFLILLKSPQKSLFVADHSEEEI